MIIPCFRCNRLLESPNSSNADYIIAKDTIVKEPREVLVALKHNIATRVKRDAIIAEKTITLDTREKVPPTEDFIRGQFEDDEYDTVEVPDIPTAQHLGKDLVKVVVESRQKDIQKTGIICPECYRPTDFVIWGVHKEIVE